MTLFPVFSRHLMRQLEKSGFTVIKIAPNYLHEGKIVYYFDTSNHLNCVS